MDLDKDFVLAFQALAEYVLLVQIKYKNCLGKLNENFIPKDHSYRTKSPKIRLLCTYYTRVTLNITTRWWISANRDTPLKGRRTHTHMQTCLPPAPPPLV